MLHILSSLVDPLEKVHQVSQSDIDLHLIHVLENFSSLVFALNSQGYLGPVHAKSLLLGINPVLTRAVSLLSIVIVPLKENVTLNLDHILNQERNDLPKLLDTVPQTQQNRLLQKT